MNNINKSEAEGLKPCVFFVGKDYIRKIDIPDSQGSIKVYHLYPLMEHWKAGELWDEVNPRSHENISFKSRIPDDIRETAINSPEEFYLANRGITVLAKDLRYDPNKQLVELIFTSKDDQGLADGATTDRVIEKLKAESGNEDCNYLKSARVHIEVIIGIHDDLARIHSIVKGRNTSIQVKSWSLADFRGAFNWLKEILDAETSPVRNKIGYDENSPGEKNILDILSVLTLFIHFYDEKTGSKSANQKAPTIAYSSKGRMDKHFEKNVKYYEDLRPIIIDIIELYEYVVSKFEKAYSDSKDGKHRLGARQGVVPLKTQIKLPLTGLKTKYIIPSGLIFPLVASLRALVEYDQSGLAFWKMNPRKFFDEYGGELVSCLNGLWEALGNNPNTCGKKPIVYTSIHDRAKNIVFQNLQEIKHS